MEPSVLVNKFYAAFAQRDGESMAACYHPDVHFSDPVFPDLRGRDAGDMWRMLTSTGKDLQVVA
nr:nuclear transport factor 2 family protein [Deltaproteobacteria bacterium]